MSDTPRVDALAQDVEHLGPGGRSLYEGRLWDLAYQLERELTCAIVNFENLAEGFTALTAERDALREAMRRWLRADDALDTITYATPEEKFAEIEKEYEDAITELCAALEGK